MPTRPSFSSTAIRRSGRREAISRAAARPTMPAPTTTRSHSPSGAAGDTRWLPGLLLRHAALEQLEVGVHHQANQLLEAGAGLPTELLTALGVVAYQVLDLGGPEESRVPAHVLLGVQSRVLEG